MAVPMGIRCVNARRAGLALEFAAGLSGSLGPGAPLIDRAAIRARRARCLFLDEFLEFFEGDKTVAVGVGLVEHGRQAGHELSALTRKYLAT